MPQLTPYAVDGHRGKAAYRAFDEVWGPRFAMLSAGEHGRELLLEPYCQSYAVDPETGQVAAQNSCGTTSLAMVMNFFRPGSASQSRIDATIRRSNALSFTVPSDILDYARRAGFQAVLRNRARLSDLKQAIDGGLPAIVIIEPLGSSNGRVGPVPEDAELHYVVVGGYALGADGAVARLIVSDPWGLYYTMDAAQFESHWANLRWLSLPTGLDRCMIVLAPPGESLPVATASADDDLWAAMTFAGGVMDLRNILSRPLQPAAGVGHLAGGLLKLAAAGPAWVLGRVGLGPLGGGLARGALDLADATRARCRGIGR